jgi:death-on-curing family protein
VCRLHILSDLHFEFQKWRTAIDVNAIDADVSILAGDIAVGLEGIAWALQAFKRPVIYVMGNHEYYGQRAMQKTFEKTRQKCAGTHVHLLENETVTIGNVRFIGATLWTDFNLLGADRQAESMDEAQRERTDYSVIFCSRRGSRLAEPGFTSRRQGDLLTPKKVLAMHTEGREFIKAQLAIPFSGQTVVVTHHAPSALSLKDGVAMSSSDTGDASALDDLVARSNLWVHGHTHVCADYRIGSGRVISNPRGYKDTGPDSVKGFDPRLVVDTRSIVGREHPPLSNTACSGVSPDKSVASRNQLTEALLGKEISFLFVSVAEAVFLHDGSISRVGGIAGIRDRALLESALHRPMQQCLDEDETDLFQLAGTLADGIAKNHAFLDGNKRTAFLCCEKFLKKNGVEFSPDVAAATEIFRKLENHEIDQYEVAEWLRSISRSTTSVGSQALL